MEDFQKYVHVRGGNANFVHTSYHEHFVVGNTWPFGLLVREYVRANGRGKRAIPIETYELSVPLFRV